MAQKPLLGFQKPIHATPRRSGKSSLVRVHEESTEDGAIAGCSCGWVKVHKRKAVVTRATDKHVQDKHGGRAIWL